MSSRPTDIPSAPEIAEDEDDGRLCPKEGWHIVHLFYHIDHSQWSMLAPEEQLAAKTAFSELVQEVRSHPDTQLLTFSMVTPKADLGLMLLTPDLNDANAFEKRLTLALGPDVLSSTFSYLSMTERSEYTTNEEDYAKQVKKEKGLEDGSEELEAALGEFRARIKKYTQDRLYPNMPDWPVFCFYPMNKRRGEKNNWYDMGIDARKELMAGHARIGRQWAGKIRQLITGSTGLDEAEWGVTLFAKDTFEVKAIVYEMRFDEVSAKYADFGDFYIGIQLPLNELFGRLGL